MGSFYSGLEPHELPLHLEVFDEELRELHRRRAELEVEEQIVQAHRTEILRLMGVIVLKDRNDENTH